MTSEQTTADNQTIALVMKDTAGRYYVLPSEVLEAARVPEAEAAAVERFLAEADGDVQGYRDKRDIIIERHLSYDLRMAYQNDGTSASIGALAAGVGTALREYYRQGLG